jgi:hypothetical protein
VQSLLRCNSLLLFNIFLDPIARLFRFPEFQRPLQRDASPAALAKCPCPPLHHAIRLTLFADDIRVASDTRLAGWQDCFQLALDKLSGFAAEWRLSFSLDGEKSAIVYFRRPGSDVLKDAQRFPQQFTLCGQPLVLVEKYKYLGVWLHQSLSWEPHFQHLLARNPKDEPYWDDQS